MTLREQLVAVKRRAVETALLEHGGNRSRAARALGVQRTYVCRLIRELGITLPAPGNTRPKDTFR